MIGLAVAASEPENVTKTSVGSSNTKQNRLHDCTGKLLIMYRSKYFPPFGRLKNALAL